MKHLFELIINLIIWFLTIWLDLFGIIWYGKLPKISTYHNYKMGASFREYFNDIYIQSKYFRVLNEGDILNILSEVCKDCNDLPDDIPIRDKNGEIFGSQGLYTYLSEKFKKEIKKESKS